MEIYGYIIVVLFGLLLWRAFSIDPSGQNGRDRRFRGWPFNDEE